MWEWRLYGLCLICCTMIIGNVMHFVVIENSGSKVEKKVSNASALWFVFKFGIIWILFYPCYFKKMHVLSRTHVIRKKIFLTQNMENIVNYTCNCIYPILQILVYKVVGNSLLCLFTSSFYPRPWHLAYYPFLS